MKRKIKNDEPASFRLRKFIHYSLLLCILLIQLLIAGFFYNEFVSRKNSKFILNKSLITLLRNLKWLALA